MTTKELAGGVVHKLPTDLRKTLLADRRAVAAWGDITPLARNEWICWVENAKHLETRSRRIKRTSSELLEGMRRPCCWVGCTHRTDKPVSPSVKAVLDKQSKKSS